MSKLIKPLSKEMIQALTIIHGAMELGLYDASLTACKQAHTIAQKLVLEIEAVIKERQQNEVNSILELMPGSRKTK